MLPDDWNKSDDFILHLYSPVDPFSRGFDGLEAVLGAIESLPGDLRPDTMDLKRSLPYSRQTLRKRLPDTFVINGHSLQLSRTHPPDASVLLSSWAGTAEACFSIEFRISPHSFMSEQGKAEKRAGDILAFVRAISTHLPLSYGLGHSSVDFAMSSDPHASNAQAPLGVAETFWLNVYGSPLMEHIGRERVLSTPATLVEQLPGGAVLLLTRPTSADFASEEARLAQARALVHLRPELHLDPILASLRQRSLAFTPIPIQFDPDLADILLWEVEFRGLRNKRQTVERFNRYRPPPVSEWLPASQAPAPDVPDVKAAIETYEGLYAERLIALFHKEEPTVMDGTVEALPRMDFRLWHYGWAKNLSYEQRETLVSALGAWLGRALVNCLGGRWVPRRQLEETAVVIGDKAWLPFLRARHALQGPDAPLDYSCSQFFRWAQRLARQQAH